MVDEQSSDGQETDENGSQWKGPVAFVVVVGLFSAGIVLAYNLLPVPFLKGGFSLSTSYNKSVNRSAGPSNNLFYMEPLIVNSRDIYATDFVRVTLTLELDQPDVADELRARLAAIESAVVITAASRDSAMLRSVEGKTQLREDIAKVINEQLPNGGVRNVYFADFLVR
nr:flagellar basal body-associated FliL family protein [Nitrospirota bacterium]